MDVDRAWHWIPSTNQSQHSHSTTTAQPQHNHSQSTVTEVDRPHSIGFKHQSAFDKHEYGGGNVRRAYHTAWRGGMKLHGGKKGQKAGPKTKSVVAVSRTAAQSPVTDMGTSQSPHSHHSHITVTSQSQHSHRTFTVAAQAQVHSYAQARAQPPHSHRHCNRHMHMHIRLKSCRNCRTTARPTRRWSHPPTRR